MDFDKLVQSVDPNAVSCDDSTQLSNNVNRQIVSTKVGLAQATRP
ncbi:MAG: hypothetical protein H2174_05625 [Vampirovibrio sp.]|nr:hypothetical protein [Vampirovibrio sp.]